MPSFASIVQSRPIASSLMAYVGYQVWQASEVDLAIEKDAYFLLILAGAVAYLEVSVDQAAFSTLRQNLFFAKDVYTKTLQAYPLSTFLASCMGIIKIGAAFRTQDSKREADSYTPLEDGETYWPIRLVKTVWSFGSELIDPKDTMDLGSKINQLVCAWALERWIGPANIKGHPLSTCCFAFGAMDIFNTYKGKETLKLSVLFKVSAVGLLLRFGMPPLLAKNAEVARYFFWLS